MTKTHGTSLLASIAVLAALAGCASKPDSYYTLASSVPAAEAAAPASSVGPDGTVALAIELAPVAVPERLARPQMVVRKPGGSVQVEVLEQHRWASSFENELRDALASGVATRLGALDVSKGGRPNVQPVWRIAAQLRQFDAIDGERVTAAFTWTLRRADEPRTLVCRFDAMEPVGSGMDAVAQGAQRLTASVAAAMARSVAAARSNPTSTACAT